MTRLHAEFRRLYGLPDAGLQEPTPAEIALLTPDGQVRAMVLELARPASWDAMGRVWRGVQADLDLPAPAIAVNGVDGYALWFSLMRPVPAEQACAFLEALRRRYLGEVAAQRITMRPSADAAGPGRSVAAVAAVPALVGDAGCWSAFVAPDLAAVFTDEPWLDLEPSAEAQADLLSRLACIKPEAFAQAMERLGPLQPTDPGAATAPPGAEADAPTPAPTPTRGRHASPRQFLLDVMNNEAIALPLRIEAAKALLPYLDV